MASITVTTMVGSGIPAVPDDCPLSPRYFRTSRLKVKQT